MAGHLGVQTPGDPATSLPVSNTGRNSSRAIPIQRQSACLMQGADEITSRFHVPQARAVHAIEASTVHIYHRIRVYPNTLKIPEIIPKASKNCIGSCNHCRTKHCAKETSQRGNAEVVSRVHVRRARDCAQEMCGILPLPHRQPESSGNLPLHDRWHINDLSMCTHMPKHRNPTTSKN